LVYTIHAYAGFVHTDAYINTHIYMIMHACMHECIYICNINRSYIYIASKRLSQSSFKDVFSC
jgi:hypothetical protein